MSRTFRSLQVFNYRVWAAGSFVSNIGTWMQRVAQDWIVLTELTDHNATAVGIVMGLQFGPQMLLLPFTGAAADSLDRRKLLFVTQTIMGLLALGLGLLTLTGLVELWHVYVFAFGLGCVTAFDSPTRLSFVSELVPASQLSNAVAINSTSFNSARMIGPAIAGVLIGAIGSGWVFLLNAASFVAVLWALRLLRLDEITPRERAAASRGSFVAGFRYVLNRPDLSTVLLMLLLIGTFAVNFPIFIATMAVKVYHAGASEYGLLTSMMAIGSVAGALLAARREAPRIGILILAALCFGLGLAVAAVMPSFWPFAVVLVCVGLSAQSFTTTSNGALQLWTEPGMRGRVIALFLSVALGGTPVGAPLVGWIADTFGPRWALLTGATACFLAVAVGLRYLRRHCNLQVTWRAGLPRFRFDEPGPPAHLRPAPAASAVADVASETD